MYFVTICTEGKYDFFGEIKWGKMVLNEIGKIADEFWREIPEHFSFVEIDIYQIMPNHLHGIIVIDKKISDKTNVGSSMICDLPTVETLHCNVSTTNVDFHNLPTIKNKRDVKKNLKFSIISPKPGSLSTIIRSYKSAVTKISKSINPGFTWQNRFYDHIVKNEQSLFKTRDYIANNPAKWEFDRNNHNDLWM